MKKENMLDQAMDMLADFAKDNDIELQGTMVITSPETGDSAVHQFDI